MRSKAIVLLVLTVVAAPLAGQITGRNGIKKGGWKPQDVPEGYKVYDVGRYEFQSNAEPERVKRIADHLNAMFKIYAQLFPSKRTFTQRFVVKVFKDREGFIDYGAPPGAGAYYSWVDKEMVGYDTGLLDGELDPTRFGGTTGDQGDGRLGDALRKKFTMDTIGAFAHEGWHQYFHWYCASKVDFPSWCDEGIGEYFYPTKLRKGSKPELGRPNTYRLGTIKAAIHRGRHVPLHELVTWNQQQYYGVAGLAYAEGWSLVHFLLEHPAYKKKNYVRRFVEEFTDKHSITKAVDVVFAKADWAKIEADWKQWVLDMVDPSAEEVEKAEEELFGDALAEALRRGLAGEGGEGEKPASEGGEPAPPAPAGGSGAPPGPDGGEGG